MVVQLYSLVRKLRLLRMDLLNLRKSLFIGLREPNYRLHVLFFTLVKSSQLVVESKVCYC